MIPPSKIGVEDTNVETNCVDVGIFILAALVIKINCKHINRANDAASM